MFSIYYPKSSRDSEKRKGEILTLSSKALNQPPTHVFSNIFVEVSLSCPFFYSPLQQTIETLKRGTYFIYLIQIRQTIFCCRNTCF